MSSQGLLASITYSGISVLMVLLNRVLMSSKQFGCKQTLTVVATQCLIGVCILYLTRAARLIRFNNLTQDSLKLWLPLAIFFVAMLFSATEATGKLPIHLSSAVFKNSTNVLVVLGEWLFYSKKPNVLIVLSLLFMLMGAVMTSMQAFFRGTDEVDSNNAANDDQTSIGVIWALLNCVCTASFVLYLRFVATRRTKNSSRFDAAHFNNILAPILLIGPIWWTNEYSEVLESNLFSDRLFVSTLMLSGVLGVALGLASYWCVTVTSATTYATVGALNKIPVAFVGIVLLGESLSRNEMIQVFCALVGGVLFAIAKMPSSKS